MLLKAQSNTPWMKTIREVIQASALNTAGKTQEPAAGNDITCATVLEMAAVWAAATHWKPYWVTAAQRFPVN